MAEFDLHGSLPDKSKFYNKVDRLSCADKTRLLNTALKWCDDFVVNGDQSNVFASRTAQQVVEFYSSLLTGELTVTKESGAKWIEAVERHVQIELFIPGYMGIVGFVYKYFEQDYLDAWKPQILQLIETHSKEEGDMPSTIATYDRLKELLGVKEKWELYGSQGWVKEINKDLASFDLTTSSAFEELFNLSTYELDMHASEQWLIKAEGIIIKVGEAQYKNIVCRWLKVFIENNQKQTLTLDSKNEVILRGLIWACKLLKTSPLDWEVCEEFLDLCFETDHARGCNFEVLGISLLQSQIERDLDLIFPTVYKRMLITNNHVSKNNFFSFLNAKAGMHGQKYDDFIFRYWPNENSYSPSELPEYESELAALLESWKISDQQIDINSWLEVLLLNKINSSQVKSLVWKFKTGENVDFGLWDDGAMRSSAGEKLTFDLESTIVSVTSLKELPPGSLNYFREVIIRLRVKQSFNQLYEVFYDSSYLDLVQNNKFYIYQQTLFKSLLSKNWHYKYIFFAGEESIASVALSEDLLVLIKFKGPEESPTDDEGVLLYVQFDELLLVDSKDQKIDVESLSEKEIQIIFSDLAEFLEDGNIGSDPMDETYFYVDDYRDYLERYAALETPKSRMREIILWDITPNGKIEENYVLKNNERYSLNSGLSNYGEQKEQMCYSPYEDKVLSRLTAIMTVKK